MGAKQMVFGIPKKRCSGRLMIDHTHTTEFGFQTGVQRVVRKICEHANQASSEMYNQVVPVMLDEAGFRASNAFGPSLDTVGANSRSKRLPIIRQILASNKWLHSNRWWPTKRILPQCTGIDFSEGDTLLLPDAYWALPQVWPAVKKARMDGACTAVVIYDLIPHTHSDIYGEQGAEGFRNYIRTAFRHADCFIAISQTVRNQLHTELPKILGEPLSDFKIEYFDLGAEFEDTSGEIQNQVRQTFNCSTRVRPLLMVGTIEARKNHHFVLDTMDKLWEHFPERQLCIVGRPGWKGESVIDRIRKHTRYQKQLFWFDNASDADLLHCYKNTSGLIFASIAEGFGLPIVEALWHGCDAFVSDIDIHREVGKNNCSYFDLRCKDSLLQLLKTHELPKESLANSPSSAHARVQIRPKSWPKSVEGLLEKIYTATPNVQQSIQVLASSH